MNEEKKAVLTEISAETPAYTRRRKGAASASKAKESRAKMAENDITFIREDPTPLILINEISKLFLDKMREIGDNTVSGSYRHLIFHLAQKDGRTQLELARLTHLKPPTVSLSLAKLEAEGYIRREADPVDLRQTRVYLTEKGRETDNKAREAFFDLENEVVSELSEEEQKRLITTLKKIRDKL